MAACYDKDWSLAFTIAQWGIKDMTEKYSYNSIGFGDANFSFYWFYISVSSSYMFIQIIIFQPV